jgi:hypothetical protein
MCDYKQRSEGGCLGDDSPSSYRVKSKKNVFEEMIIDRSSVISD